MNRDYLTQQLGGVWWAALVADLLSPVQVAITEAARPCFASHERGQAGQTPWAVGRVAAAQGSVKGATETLGGRSTGRRPGTSKAVAQRWLP
jgi:hypothetical protein